MGIVFSLESWFHCSTHCTDNSSLSLTTNCMLLIAMKMRLSPFQKERINYFWQDSNLGGEPRFTSLKIVAHLSIVNKVDMSFQKYKI